MTITGIVGFGGSGKTLLAVIFAEALKKKGFKVCTNITSYKNLDYNMERELIPLTKKQSEIILSGEEAPKILVIADEIQQYIDSRNSQSLTNKRLTQKFFQLRKYKMDFIYTLQYLSSVDIRLRRITQYYILPKFDESKLHLYYAVLSNTYNLLYEKEYNINPALFDLYYTYEDIDGNIELGVDKKRINKNLKNAGVLLD